MTSKKKPDSKIILPFVLTTGDSYDDIFRSLAAKINELIAEHNKDA